MSKDELFNMLIEVVIDLREGKVFYSEIAPFKSVNEIEYDAKFGRITDKGTEFENTTYYKYEVLDDETLKLKRYSDGQSFNVPLSEIRAHYQFRKFSDLKVGSLNNNVHFAKAIIDYYESLSEIQKGMVDILTNSESLIDKILRTPNFKVTDYTAIMDLVKDVD